MKTWHLQTVYTETLWWHRKTIRALIKYRINIYTWSHREKQKGKHELWCQCVTQLITSLVNEHRLHMRTAKQAVTISKQLLFQFKPIETEQRLYGVKLWIEAQHSLQLILLLDTSNSCWKNLAFWLINTQLTLSAIYCRACKVFRSILSIFC